jgi:hypothetical protein
MLAISANVVALYRKTRRAGADGYCRIALSDLSLDNKVSENIAALPFGRR